MQQLKGQSKEKTINLVVTSSRCLSVGRAAEPRPLHVWTHNDLKQRSEGTNRKKHRIIDFWIMHVFLHYITGGYWSYWWHDGCSWKSDWKVTQFVNTRHNASPSSCEEVARTRSPWRANQRFDFLHSNRHTLRSVAAHTAESAAHLVTVQCDQTQRPPR